MRGRRTMLFIAAATLTPIAARAQPGLSCDVGAALVAAVPTAILRVSHAGMPKVCVNLSNLFVTRDGGKTFGLGAGPLSLGGIATLNSLSIGVNTDPFITFGASTTNLLPGTTDYAFLVATPIVPAMYNRASASGGVTVAPGISGTSSTGVGAAYPAYVSGYSNAFLTNHGVDVTGAACIATAVNNTCNYGPVSRTFAAALFADLDGELSYSQTDQLSTASWSARVDLTATAVPEPATVALTAVGLLALAIRRRRVG